VLQVRSSVSSARCSSTHTATHTATKCNTLQHRYTCYQRLTNCSFLFCNTLQHTATQIYLPPAPHELQLPVLQHTCNRLQQTATDGNRLQHTAAHCNTDLLLISASRTAAFGSATHCNTLQHTLATQIYLSSAPHELQLPVLHHTATDCNRRQQTATDCSTLQHRSTSHQHLTNRSFLFYSTLQHTATHCSTHCNTHCNTDLPLISTSRTTAFCSLTIVSSSSSLSPCPSGISSLRVSLW